VQQQLLPFALDMIADRSSVRIALCQMRALANGSNTLPASRLIFPFIFLHLTRVQRCCRPAGLSKRRLGAVPTDRVSPMPRGCGGHAIGPRIRARRRLCGDPIRRETIQLWSAVPTFLSDPLCELLTPFAKLA
jgi:hypothetical protein